MPFIVYRFFEGADITERLVFDAHTRTSSGKLPADHQRAYDRFIEAKLMKKDSQRQKDAPTIDASIHLVSGK